MDKVDDGQDTMKELKEKWRKDMEKTGTKNLTPNLQNA